MATKKIEIQDSNGNVYYPHTDASVVKNGSKTVAEQLNEKVNKSSIINNCSVTEEGFALDARQGKRLRDILQVDKIKTYTEIITLTADTIQNIEIDFPELGMASTPFYATCIMASGNNGSLREIRYEFDASTKDKAIFKLISDTPMEAIPTRFSFLIVHQ